MKWEWIRFVTLPMTHSISRREPVDRQSTSPTRPSTLRTSNRWNYTKKYPTASSQIGGRCCLWGGDQLSTSRTVKRLVWLVAARIIPPVPLVHDDARWRINPMTSSGTH